VKLVGWWVRHLRVPERFIISFRNTAKEIWDVFVLLLAFQNSLVIPLDLAFAPQFAKTPRFELFDQIVDGIFFLDMLLMFVTSFMNKRGEEELDSKEIAKKYMSSIRFHTDFLAILGNSYLSAKIESFKAFGFFKIIRVLRLGGIIARLNI